MENHLFRETENRYTVKGIVLWICAFYAISLSGCSAAEDYFIEVSGLMTEEEYQKYIELKESGQLDQQHHYIIEEMSEKAEADSDIPSGIHVTFGKNAYIDIVYYFDAGFTQVVDETSCYLNPGDCIYAQISESNHSSNRWYCFDHFGIVSYDENGNRGEELVWLEEKANLVLCIPEDYTGREIAVEPRGRYEQRSLHLTDYYKDSDGQVKEMDGTWIVNEKEITGKTAQVSSAELLYVDYRYDPEKYVFVSSEPASFYHDKGLVRFETASAENMNENYSVELRPVKGAFFFDPALYSAEHGKVSFWYKGIEIIEGRNIPDGDVVEYRAEAETGYRHSHGTGEIVIDAMDAEETEKRIRDIMKFNRDEMVEVVLPRDIVGGDVEYMINGRVITGKTYKTLSGTVVTMNFYPWNGWKCMYEDGEEYVVPDFRNPVVTVQGKNGDDKIFVEDEDHKPEVSVILDKSAENVVFTLIASGVEEADHLTYAQGDNVWFSSNRVIYKGKIGTDNSIVLKAEDDALFKGTALRLEIEWKDTDGNECKEIRYIKKLPSREAIVIYREEEKNSVKVYEAIDITVSVVDVVDYQSKEADHAVIELRTCDVTEPYLLINGDILEPSRKVSVAIIPENGFCVVGAEEETGYYSEIMKYSEWEEEWEDILEEHPREKIWHVTLDTADDYGECIYKLDGKEVSGLAAIYEGQKLVLEYKLTDSEYQTADEYETRGVFGWKKYVYEFTVSEELDGQVIRRSDYIRLERKENKQ